MPERYVGKQIGGSEYFTFAIISTFFQLARLPPFHSVKLVQYSSQRASKTFWMLFASKNRNYLTSAFSKIGHSRKKDVRVLAAFSTAQKRRVSFLLLWRRAKNKCRPCFSIIIQKQEIKSMKRKQDVQIFDKAFVQNYQQPKIETNKSLLIKIDPYLISGNIFILAIKAAIQITLLLVSLIFYLLDSNSQFSSQLAAAFEISIKTSFLAKQPVLIIIGSYLVSILVIQNIVVHHFLKLRKYRIVKYVNNKLDALLIIGLEFNILLSTLILLIDKQVQLAKIINFGLANSIALFVDGFMQCTGRPTDLLCTNNHKFIVILRVLSVINLVLCISKKFYRLNQMLIIVFEMISCIIVSSCYLQSGYRTYRHYYSKFYLLVLVTQFISTAIIMMLQYLGINSLGNILITIISIFLGLRTKVKSQKNVIIDMEKCKLLDLKNFQSSLSQIIEDNNMDGNCNCWLIGLIQMHKTSSCSNFHCFTHKDKLYCPEYDCQVNLNILVRYEMVIKYLIKCLYQQLIMKNPQNGEIVLSYCQFSYNEMKNILPLAIHLHKLERMTLTLYQRMRLHGLKQGLKQDVKKMNPINLNNDVEFQKVVAFDEIYSQVAIANAQTIEMNKHLWERLSQANIEIHSIVQLIQEINENKKRLEGYWTSLQKYIDLWPKIKKIHAFYCLFINNSFKKQKEINALSQLCRRNEEKSQRHPLTTKTFILQNDVFNQNSIIIHNNLQRDGLVIKKCSKSIEILGYHNDQVKMCELSIIMPHYFRNYHAQKFNNWMDQGFVNLEKLQKGVDIFCVNKVDVMINVVKTFKLFVNQSNQIEFACLLLILPGQQTTTAICDIQTKCIEEATSKFISLFSLSMSDLISRTQNLGNFIQNINDLVGQLKNNEHSQPFQLLLSSNNKVYSCVISRVESNHKKFQINFKDILPKRQYQMRSMEFMKPASKPQATSINISEKKTQKNPSNIFMKQEPSIPNLSFKQIQLIKYTLHIFVTLLLTMFVIIMLISNQNYLQLKEHVEQHLSMIIVAKQPLLLGIKYYEVIAQLQEVGDVDPVIVMASNVYQEAIDSATFIRTIFDASLFPEQQSYGLIGNFSISSDLSNVDIIYLLSSSIASLKSETRQFQGQDFKNFITLIPTFSQILDQAKDLMQESYSTYYKNIKIPSIVFIQFQCGLFLLVFSLTTYNYFKACRKVREIFEIMVKVDRNELERIKEYWSSLGQEFFRLSLGVKCKNEKRKQDNFCKQVIEPGKRLKRKERIIYFSGVFSLVIKFIITGILQIYISAQIKSIQAFGSLSACYFDFYPSNLLIGYGMIQKHYEETQDYHATPFNFEYAFEDIDQLSNLAYIPSNDLSSPFYSALKNYYFGNPCKFNPNIIARLNITERDCTINGGYLSNGIVSYGQSIRTVQEKYLKNAINLSRAEVYNQTKWAIVANDYIENLINLWGETFISEIEQARTGTIYMYCSMFVLVMAIHYAIAHKTFICSIGSYYQQYVHIYDVIVSKDRSQDKMVKSELMRYGFIGL